MHLSAAREGCNHLAMPLKTYTTYTIFLHWNESARSRHRDGKTNWAERRPENAGRFKLGQHLISVHLCVPHFAQRQVWLRPVVLPWVKSGLAPLSYYLMLQKAPQPHRQLMDAGPRVQRSDNREALGVEIATNVSIVA